MADSLVFPPPAALLDVGGLWLLYRTGLFAAMRHEPWLHAAVQSWPSDRCSPSPSASSPPYAAAGARSCAG
ncbi:hypothetical protein ABZ078_31185 [Streptomyces sp. NPDC006385]|uniref:hypothetical protein n=1 Tax=Streptomyces sp. NPDC006385 TaxID=3156761 RepID=UPI0033B72BFF